MGTNYYFYPKEYNRNIHNKIFESYVKDIEDSVAMYKRDMLQAVKAKDPFIDIEYKEFDRLLQFLYLDTPPRIHIGKISYGWNPLLQSNEYYSSMKELKSFYKKYKNNIKVLDEYDEEISFEELLDKLETAKLQKDNYTHRGIGMNVKVDKEGWEFSPDDYS